MTTAWGGLSAGSANVLGVVADVFLLSRCKGLVGTHTSAVSKAAYLLMYSRMGPAATVTDPHAGAAAARAKFSVVVVVLLLSYAATLSQPCM